MDTPPPIVLSIAGYDPSSGAGVTADIKTIAAHGCFGLTCITALTVQSTVGVKRVEPLAAALVRDTLEELAADFSISGVRIGMLGSAAVAEAVAAWLESARRPNVVLDPILKASSGPDLLDSRGVALLRDRLLRLADVITPNVDEAGVLANMAVSDLASMRAAAERLHEIGARAVVVTGGHLKQPVDLLSATRRGKLRQQTEFKVKRVNSRSTHGTGCAFATALACNLAKGFELEDSVKASGRYVREAIAHAVRLGRGNGPINLLYGMREE
jgi:hydroxymethylpyrimidine/phosphomethylpyrimidine kinase